MQAGASIGYDEYHGIIHDLTMEIGFSLSPEEADNFYQLNLTVADLAALIASKVQILQRTD